MCTALIKVSFFAIPRHHRRPLFSVACATAIMGNLLGAPITEKKTHTGTTPAAGKGGVDLPYGVSSMQGWRVHMVSTIHIILCMHLREGRKI